MELILSQIGTASFFKIVTKQEWIEGCPKQGSAHFCNQIIHLKKCVLLQLLLIWKWESTGKKEKTFLLTHK